MTRLPESVTLRPYRVFFLALVAVVPVHVVAPVVQIVTFPYTVAGLVPLAIGIMLGMGWSSTIAGHQQPGLYTSRPDRLITNGPFRISRNPLYLGMLLIVLGLAVLLGSMGAAAVVAVAWALMNWFGIPPEERVLEEQFGDDYHAYRCRVRRWI